MKALLKKLPVLLLAGAISVSCGKDSNSSGSKGSSTDGVSGLPDNTYTQDQAYSSIEQVRSAFQNKSMSDGVTTGNQFYHMGDFYGGSTGGFEFNINWCWSDCGLQQMIQGMEERITYGRQIKIASASQDEISYNIATAVAENDGYPEYIYGETGSFSRNAGMYQEMLGLDLNENNIFGGSAEGIKVTPATITMQNGSTLQAQMVEYFIGSKNQYRCNVYDVKRYVLSAALPIVANPALVLESGTPIGKLSEVNGTGAVVQSIAVQGYNQVNQQSCTIERVQQQLTF